MHDPDDLLTPRQAAPLMKVTVPTLANQRCRGGGCRFVKIHGRIYYRRADIAEYLAENTYSSTAEYAESANY